ncbi:AAA family ATPase [Alteromonas stellipolaris]|uniref:AAA family ATPase n=1 Tax=Alteromonas stellipolaris TaxID=233316 RepID=UPI00249475CA|nr:AAA family ATPase [Alteromonas stellipolaris]
MEEKITSAKIFKIIFCNRETSYNDIVQPTIEFIPDSDSWNDFKYKSTYRYRIIIPASPIIEGTLFLGFVSKSELVEESGRLKFSVDQVDAEQLPTFFTLQGGMKEYRQFIKKRPLKEANLLLIALNDLVALKGTPKASKLIDEAMKTKVFNLAFMRDNERFFAFNNAESLLDGLEEESLEGISSHFSLTYQLAGFDEPNSFHIDFEATSILPKRLSLLIGRNGLGKSQALHAIVQALLKGNDTFEDREQGRPRISRLLAIATPGETANTFPPERKNKRIKYRRLTLNRSGRTKAGRSFCDICYQLARNEEDIGQKRRWQLFCQSSKVLNDSKSIYIEISEKPSVKTSKVVEVNNRLYYPLLKLGSGGEQEMLEVSGALISNANPVYFIDGHVYPMSSGQLAFIKFLAQACLFIENGSLVLLDEPETHLHPNFISDFVKILNRLLELTGSYSIIATHSAYFVREVPRTQVHVFKQSKSKRVVDIMKPTLKTFGADVGALSYFVFEDEITNGLVDEIIIKLNEKGRTKAKLIVKELENELSSDVIMYLRRKLDIGDNIENN